MANEINARLKGLGIRWDAMQTTIEAYLVMGKVNALIDSGPPQSSPEPMTSALEPFGLRPADIDFALHTHGHLDHIGGDRVLKAVGRTQLWIHKEDAVFLEDHGRSFDLFYAPGRGGNVQQEKAAFQKQMEPEFKADRFLEDDQLIDLGEGLELRVIHLPGHTPGSVGFYWEKEGIMLAGDSVQGLGSMAGFLPIIYDFTRYEKSIARLMEIPLKSLYFCHPYRSLNLPPSLAREGKDVPQYLSDSLEVFKRLRETIERRVETSADRSLGDVAEDVIRELGDEMGYKRISELQAPQFSLGTVFRGLFQLKGRRT